MTQLICWSVIAWLVWSIAISVRYMLRARTLTITRGVTGFAGDTVTLMCPVGKVIKPTSATYGCDISNGGVKGCDPFLPNGNFDPATTATAAALLAPTSGKQRATITVPSVTLCAGSCPRTMLVGTYDCVPV